MNTIFYELSTGRVTGFVSGSTLKAQDGGGVIYSTKELADIVDSVVLDDALTARVSIEYALSEKSSLSDKAQFWKEHRAKLLAESDYMMLPDVGDSAFQERAKAYRLELRDLPKHVNWPALTLADIPTKPNPNTIQLTMF